MRFVRVRKIPLKQTILFAFFVLLTSPASAFYEYQEGDAYMEARGLVRAFVNASHSPDDPSLFPDRHSAGAAGVVRLMVDGRVDDYWGYEFNLYQVYIPNVLIGSQAGTGVPGDVERSAMFEASFSDHDYARLVMDRAALRWSKDNLEFTAGRQAINLATTFYFTPNDFFAPFAAQTFYRVYKPGVDGFRTEIGVGELSQLSLISVFGYAPEAANDSGWSRYVSSQRDAQVVRWSSAFGNAEAIFVGGRVADSVVVGGAFQGELFEWLGVRLEGHHTDVQSRADEDYSQLTLGVEHRWENSFDLRWELFYNGAGNDSVGNYNLNSSATLNAYLARRYSAIGGSYEFTPLLNGGGVVITNLDDRSHLVSLNAVYSLSDESDAVLNVSLPMGDEPTGGDLISEFGSYPYTVSAEYRLYY